MKGIEYKTHRDGYPKIVAVFYGSDEEFAEFRQGISTLNYYREKSGKRLFTYSMKKGGIKIQPRRIKKVR